MHLLHPKQRSGYALLVLFAMCGVLVFTLVHAEEAEDSWAHLEKYCADLISHAEGVARFSPYAAEDIRAVATDLAGKAHGAENPEERQKVLEEFRSAYGDIFPEKDGHPLPPFEARARALLEEIPDVLPSVFTALRSDVTSLQATLSTLSDPASSSLWFDHFETFARTLLSLSPPPPLPLLTEDLRHLLENLASYLETMESLDVKTSVTHTEVTELQGKLSTLVTESALDQFLEELETLLTRLSPP